jgi:hypothetical protein
MDVANDRSRDAGMLLKVIVVLLVALVLEQSFQVVNVVSGSSLRSWQYMIDSPTDAQLTARLQELGSTGWELISARRAVSDVGGRSISSYEMIFRRESGVAGTFLPTPAAK